MSAPKNFLKLYKEKMRPAPLFVGADVSVGVENEFQAAVEGRAAEVDLPLLTILGSRCYNNLSPGQTR